MDITLSTVKVPIDLVKDFEDGYIAFARRDGTPVNVLDLFIEALSQITEDEFNYLIDGDIFLPDLFNAIYQTAEWRMKSEYNIYVYDFADYIESCFPDAHIDAALFDTIQESYGELIDEYITRWGEDEWVYDLKEIPISDINEGDYVLYIFALSYD